MLTRDFLISADCHTAFGAIDAQLYWNEGQRAASLAATLAQRPSGQPVWVFGYGSLMWNPIIEFNERVAARLDGWQRAFCLRLIAGRGTPARPGRMLALQQGGETQGVAYRLDESVLAHELPLLWKREMVTGCYRPQWCPLRLADGREVQGLAFTIDPRHVLYEADTRPQVVAPLIAGACGTLGTNAQYLYALEQELAGMGLNEPALCELAQQVRQLEGQQRAAS